MATSGADEAESAWTEAMRVAEEARIEYGRVTDLDGASVDQIEAAHDDMEQAERAAVRAERDFHQAQEDEEAEQDED